MKPDASELVREALAGVVGAEGAPVDPQAAPRSRTGSDPCHTEALPSRLMDPAPPLWHELAKSGVQALVVVVGVLAGWGLLRRQERIKRQEELWAGMRRLRADALVKSLEAIGRYHNRKERRIDFEKFESLEPDHVKQLRSDEAEAYWQAIDTRAAQRFLLGALTGPLDESIEAMFKAKSRESLDGAVTSLHAALAKWIPPLEPHG